MRCELYRTAWLADGVAFSLADGGRENGAARTVGERTAIPSCPDPVPPAHSSGPSRAPAAGLRHADHRNIAAATCHHSRDVTRTMAALGMVQQAAQLPGPEGLPEVPRGRDRDDTQVVKRRNGA